MVRKQCSSMSQSPVAMPLWGTSVILHSPSLLCLFPPVRSLLKTWMCDKWTHTHHLSLKLSAHLEMAGISPSFMFYPPAVFSCQCIPASTAQQVGLWQAKFLCHHFLAPLPALSLLPLCNSALSQAQRRGVALSCLTKPCSTASSYPAISGGMSRGDWGASQSIRLWCIPRASWPKFCPIIKLHCIRTTLFLPLCQLLPLLQISSPSSPQCVSLCKLCCYLYTYSASKYSSASSMSMPLQKGGSYVHLQKSRLVNTIWYKS